jgi:hypothetical protein
MVRETVLRLLAVLTSAFAILAPAGAQTLVDLQHQARGIDFTGAAYTKPVRQGGALPSTCMTGEGYLLSSAPAGSNLYFCLAPNAWTLQGTSSGSGSSSSGGGSLNSLATTVNGPILTIGSGCSNSTPCNVRVGSIVYAVTNSATANLQSGSGTAYVYVSSSGTLTVGHNLTLTCTSVCTAVSGVTGFPTDSFPIAIWAASSGTWGSGTDVRAPYGRDLVVTSAGLISSLAQGILTISADPSVVSLRVASPASSTAACTSGTWASDGNYFYLCIAASTWKRTALSTF